MVLNEWVKEMLPETQRYDYEIIILEPGTGFLYRQNGSRTTPLMVGVSLQNSKPEERKCSNCVIFDDEQVQEISSN